MPRTPREITPSVLRLRNDVRGDTDAWFRRIDCGRTAEARSSPDGLASGRRLGVLPGLSEPLDDRPERTLMTTTHATAHPLDAPSSDTTTETDPGPVVVSTSDR